MTVGYLNVTRVSHNMRSLSLIDTLQRGQLTMFAEQNRVAAGRRFLSPSEDPAAAAQVLHMSEILDQREQLVRNVEHGDNVLAASDVALTEANDLLAEAHSIASQHLGSLSDAEQREAAAELVSSIIDQLIHVANREFQGRYLFAGRSSGARPFVYADGGIAYVGDIGHQSVRVDEGQLEAVSFSGAEVFGMLQGAVGGLVDLDPRLTANTRIEDLAGANQLGIRREELIVNEVGGSGQFYVDLRSADTIGDVVDLFNQRAVTAGADVRMALTDTGLEVTTGGSPVSITDTTTGLIASDLGILTATATTGTIAGADLHPRLTTTTLIADLMGGAGLDLANGIVITNGPNSATIDFSTAESIQDIIALINNARVNVKARITEDGTGLEVVNLISGTAMSIGENGGTTATDLGIRSFDRSTRLADLNDGLGVETEIDEADIRITAKDGSVFDVNLDGVETIGDVIDTINDAAVAAGIAIEADLAAVGNGIQFEDTTGGGGTLSAERLNMSYAIDDLGLGGAVDGAQTILPGRDTNLIRADSVFTALQDLETALRSNDDKAVGLAGERLNVFMDDITRARGVVGARSKSFQDRLTQMEGAKYATEEYLSKLRDLDYAESITKFQTAQTALEASLMTGSRLMGLSLMDYI